MNFKTYTDGVVEQFNEQFSRTNKQTGEIEPGWFFPEILRPKDIHPFIISSLNKCREAVLSDVGEWLLNRIEDKRSFPAEMFQLNNGKMPFVVFEGKAEEAEKYQLFKAGFDDALSQMKHETISHLTKLKEENK